MSHPSYEQAASEANGQQLAQPERTNTLAIVSLVTAFFISLAAITTGHIALAQIKRTGEKGRGLAIAGLILGYVSFVLGALVLTAAVALPAYINSQSGTGANSYAAHEGSVRLDVRDTVFEIERYKATHDSGLPAATVGTHAQPNGLTVSDGNTLKFTAASDGDNYTIVGTGEGTRTGYAVTYDSTTGLFTETQDMATSTR